MKLSFESFVPPVGLEYLLNRGIVPASISFWNIGWDSDEKRIVIPAYDEEGRLKFLVKRGIWEKQQPKYLYSEGVEKTQILFGADHLPAEIESVVLVEGVLDVIALKQHGIEALAILGTGISDHQVRVLSRFRPKRVYLMFDKDAAGVRNIEIAYEKLRRYPLFVCRFPKGKDDPAELTYEEARNSLKRAVPILIWRQKVRSLHKRIRFEP
jgi:DNA primase